MSEFIKGELEYRIVAANSISIVSKEDESVDVACIDSEDDLTALEIAFAKEIVRRWNAFEEKGFVKDLYEACKFVVENCTLFEAEGRAKLKAALGKAEELE